MACALNIQTCGNQLRSDHNGPREVDQPLGGVHKPRLALLALPGRAQHAVNKLDRHEMILSFKKFQWKGESRGERES